MSSSAAFWVNSLAILRNMVFTKIAISSAFPWVQLHVTTKSNYHLFIKFQKSRNKTSPCGKPFAEIILIHCEPRFALYKDEHMDCQTRSLYPIMYQVQSSNSNSASIAMPIWCRSDFLTWWACWFGCRGILPLKPSRTCMPINLFTACRKNDVRVKR